LVFGSLPDGGVDLSSTGWAGWRVSLLSRFHLSFKWEERGYL